MRAGQKKTYELLKSNARTHLKPRKKTYLHSPPRLRLSLPQHDQTDDQSSLITSVPVHEFEIGKFKGGNRKAFNQRVTITLAFKIHLQKVYSHRVFVYLHFAETTCTGAAVKNVIWASYTLKNVTHLMEKMTMYWAFLICIIHQNNMCHNNI